MPTVVFMPFLPSMKEVTLSKNPY